MQLSLVFLFCLLTSGPSRAAETIRFDQISELVQAKNPEVAAMKLNLEAKKKREGSFGRSFLPDIYAEASQENMRLGQGASLNQSAWLLTAEINIFRGGADLQEEKVRTLESEAAQSQVQLKLQEELRRAYELYWDLVYKQDVLNTLKSHLDLSRKNLVGANRRISAGVATGTDRLEFEMTIPTLKQETALLEKDLQVLGADLSLILGLEQVAVGSDSSLNHFHDWEKKLKPLTANDLSVMKLVANEKLALQAKTGKYRGEYLPAVDLYAGYAEPNQRFERDLPEAADRRESFVGVKASWSLGRAIEAGVERGSLAKVHQAKTLQADYLGKQWQLRQRSELEELKILHSFVHDSEENIKISERYLEATLKEYARGVKNSPDVLAATDKFIQAKIRLARIVRDFNVKYSSQLALRY